MTAWLPALREARPSTGVLDPTQSHGDFSFALMSDRTGLARPGVFEHAVQAVNSLHPDFVIQIGDAIEGYTTDAEVLSAQWKDLDGILDALERPLFRVVGNHDVSNELMKQEWIRRHGVLHYHFRYNDALFLIVDTSDPPQAPGEVAGDLTVERRAELHALRDADPEAVRREFEALADWESTMPADISEEQVAYFQRALANNSDLRWTFVCMHIPAWQGEGHPSLDRLYAEQLAQSHADPAGGFRNAWINPSDRRQAW